MSRINSNISALRALHRLERNQTDLNISLERLATGLRINRGADDPAGLIASERLRFEIRGLQQAVENSTRAANVITTAEGALQEVSALLLDLQSLVVAAANEAGITPDEVAANQLQIDSILDSIDRISNTTRFAGRKLLDGSLAYTISTIPTAAFDSLSVFAAQVPLGESRTVNVQVTQSAQRAQLSFAGSATSAATVEIRGNLGAQVLSLVSGATLAEIAAAVNDATATTGVTATVASGGSAVTLQSEGFGSDSFLTVLPINGDFIEPGTEGQTLRDVGQDAGVIVNGIRAGGRGLVADVRTSTLDARIYLNEQFAQTLSSATFSITGGGALFQITPQLNPNGQINMAFNSVHTTNLSDAVVGLLYTLRSGEANDLAGKNFPAAQSIVNRAIDQISTYRGRLGNAHRNQIEPAINSQTIAIENVTASESVVRDADMAAEVSNLTRAQILVQSTQRTLQIANATPQQVLALLQ